MNVELPEALAQRVEALAQKMPLPVEAILLEVTKEGLDILERVARQVDTPLPDDDLDGQPVISRGSVRFYDARKFWGIIDDSGGQGVFLHVSELRGATVAAGDKLEYRIETNHKGLTARDVKVLAKTNQRDSDLDGWRKEKYSV